MYAIQLIDAASGSRREYRVTGEIYDYIAQIIRDAEGLPGVYQTEIGEH